MPNELTPIAIRDHADDALASPEATQVLRGLKDLRGRRRPSKRACTVLNWDARPDDPLYSHFQPFPGSATVYWAHPGSTLIRQLEYAHLTHDLSQLAELGNRVVESHRRRSLMSLENAFHVLEQSESFFDLRYDGRVLAEAVWAPQEGCGTLVLPYTGGRMTETAFSLVDYFRHDYVGAPADVLIVLRAPQLSEIELAALEAVPSELSEIQIIDLPVACTVLLTIALFVTAVTIVTTCCDRFNEKLNAVEINGEVMQRLGAVSTVSELLRMRWEIFEEFGIR